MMLTPSRFNEWLRLVVAPLTGIALAVYLSVANAWVAYEPPLIVLMVFGPAIVSGVGGGGKKNGAANGTA